MSDYQQSSVAPQGAEYNARCSSLSLLKSAAQAQLWTQAENIWVHTQGTPCTDFPYCEPQL